ncbi:hypothetical protein KKHLCK_03660 [Candidatus Electrothrix laxa]
MANIFINYSILFVLFLSVVIVLVANIYYVVRAFYLDQGEGRACIIMMAIGYISYILGKAVNIELAMVIFSAVTGLIPGMFGQGLLAAISFFAGYLLGKFYSRQAQKNNFKAFRLTLPLLSMLHCLLVDIFLFQLSGKNNFNMEQMYPSAVFIIGLGASWALSYEGPTKGNVINPKKDEIFFSEVKLSSPIKEDKEELDLRLDFD